MSDEFGFDPLTYVEEDRDVLEKIAALRAESREFPKHLLTTDPLVARRIILASKAERTEAAKRDYSVPPCQMRARPALDHEWPRAAKTLMKKLFGWTTSAWLMRGPMISAQNRERTIKTCFALKADHPDGRRVRTTFYAKADGKWDREADWLWVPSENVPWRKAASVKAVEAYVADDVQRPDPIALEV